MAISEVRGSDGDKTLIDGGLIDGSGRNVRTSKHTPLGPGPGPPWEKKEKSSLTERAPGLCFAGPTSGFVTAFLGGLFLGPWLR